MIARRNVSSMSCRHNVNGPSNVHTSGASSRTSCPFAWRGTRWPLRDFLMRIVSFAIAGQKSGVPRYDLQRDLGRWIGSEIACAVNPSAIGEPVAFGEHADHLRPMRIVAIAAIRRRIPFVGTERSAG